MHLGDNRSTRQRCGHSISVALCTHNGGRFIQEQIESICQQSLLPAEIVLSDDASSDNCVDLAQTIVAGQVLKQSRSLPTLHILRNSQPLKVVKNFEQAIKACTGDLIALCDQDDVWHTDRLVRMAQEFVQRPDLLLLHSNAKLIDSTGGDLSQSLFDAIEVQGFELDWIHTGRALDAFLRRNLVTGATTLFHRSLLQYALPFPKEWLHDEWLAIVAACIGLVDVMEDRLIDYRQHATNQIGARRETLLWKIQKAFATRDDTLSARATKVEVLLERLERLDKSIPATTIAKLHAKLVHQRFRANLPKRRLARLVPVLRELLTGRYNQFGRGLHCVARDLLESG